MSNNGEILLIDKPAGITSFDVIRSLRKALGIRKMGHAGTLDPMATGLLIVATEAATKQLQTLLKLDKTYEARIVLGESYDTGDVTGTVRERARAGHIPREDVERALGKLVGEQVLPVPAYSAIKQGGERLYKKARAGESFEPPTRRMRIAAAELKGFERKGDHAYADVVFHVGSGTYIRSLAEELGRRLGVPAALAALRRTKIGEMHVENAHMLDVFAREQQNT